MVLQSVFMSMKDKFNMNNEELNMNNEISDPIKKLSVKLPRLTRQILYEYNLLPDGRHRYSHQQIDEICRKFQYANFEYLGKNFDPALLQFDQEYEDPLYPFLSYKKEIFFPNEKEIFFEEF